MNLDLAEITRVMRDLCSTDISVYDESFLMKTIEKRLGATAINTLADYCEYLSKTRGEVDALSRSLTITYSEFFRNPLTFAMLKQWVLPRLMEEQERTNRTEIRVWSAGCAAGQEAYSIAMLLDELISTKGKGQSFRIFATDRSNTIIETAGQGLYNFAEIQNVGLKQFHSYFSQEGEAYRIGFGLREHIDFSAYDLLDELSNSPPASIYGDFDLIFCSNLLFYYRPEIRQLILNKVHRSLSPNGYLVTGEVEKAIVESVNGFRLVSPPAAIFQKVER